MMKRYKVRVTGYGIEANAIIPFEVEPTIEQIENKTADYLDFNLMKIERNDFLQHKTPKGEDKYNMTYEELKD